MSILLLLVFISLIFVLLAILLFGFSVRNRDISHADRVSLLPLEEEKYGKQKNNL